MKKSSRKIKKSKAAATCMRCDKKFNSRQSLKNHSREHLQALHELTMLEQGQIPVETKLGSGFKGKNKIIVA